jgi:hypothetical protein
LHARALDQADAPISPTAPMSATWTDGTSRQQPEPIKASRDPA